jgi:hypothetical protein
LRCDEHSSANWTDEQGVHWQAFFLRWLPAESFYGRAREALSKGHNPAECLTAEGLKLESALDPIRLAVRPDLDLWFNRYVFAENGAPLYVFFCQTEDVVDSSEFSLRKTHLARFQAALAGSRNYGQNNFEVALSGPENADAALQLLRAQLPILIQTLSTSERR